MDNADDGIVSLKELTALDGIGDALATHINKCFITWEEVLEAKPEHWPKVRGLTNERKDAIRNLALTKIDTVDDLPSDIREELADALPKDEWIEIQKQVDKFTVIGKRIKITPATCRTCGFDVLKYNNVLTPFHELPQTEQLKVKGALSHHMGAAHQIGMGRGDWLE
jgi:predicted Zn-ribbon and HTH transcriptional regulator